VVGRARIWQRRGIGGWGGSPATSLTKSSEKKNLRAQTARGGGGRRLHGSPRIKGDVPGKAGNSFLIRTKMNWGTAGIRRRVGSLLGHKVSRCRAIQRKEKSGRAFSRCQNSTRGSKRPLRGGVNRDRGLDRRLDRVQCGQANKEMNIARQRLTKKLRGDWSRTICPWRPTRRGGLGLQLGSMKGPNRVKGEGRGGGGRRESDMAIASLAILALLSRLSIGGEGGMERRRNKRNLLTQTTDLQTLAYRS